MPTTTFHETTIPGLGRMSSPVTVFSASELLAIEERETERLSRNSRVMDEVLAKVRRTATVGVVAITKRQARQFIRRPSELNGLGWNLSQAEPAEGVAEVRRLARQDGPTLQLGAALLAFRWARRAERSGRLDELLFGKVA